MSHSIRQAEADRWAVMNADDVPVFEGTLRECEDWLDRWENVNRPRRSLFAWLMGAVRGVFGKKPDSNLSDKPATANEPDSRSTVAATSSHEE